MSSTTTSATSDSDDSSSEVQQAQTEKLLESKTNKRKRVKEESDESPSSGEAVKKQKTQDKATGEVKAVKKYVDKEPCQCKNCKYKKPRKEGEEIKRRKRQVNLIEDGWVLHFTGVDQAFINRVIHDFRDEDAKKIYPNGKAILLDRTLIKMDLSKEQKAEIARKYRLNTQSKKKESELDKELTPEEIEKKLKEAEKRKEYNSRPDVIARRKKVLNATREVQRELKAKNIEVVKALLKEKLGDKAPKIRMRNYNTAK